MKTLIKKTDGSAVKSKLHAVKFLEKIGIDKSELIEENGQFYYESETTIPAVSGVITKEELVNAIEKTTKILNKSEQTDFKTVSWETEVFDKNNERTKLFIPGTEIFATINAKHPAGQNRSKAAFEINIGDENFIMSVDLLSKLFKVRG